MDTFEDCSFNITQKETEGETFQIFKSYFLMTYWEATEVFHKHRDSIQILFKLH